ncbi:MAG TPA: hypothetical protein VLX28_15860, partial [Thermoanaerobaculia bacterium]|nr:hypothetical protein [Thermoanaerobaculia bacterium]
VTYVEALRREREQRIFLDRVMANAAVRERLERGDSEESLDPLLSDLTMELFSQPVVRGSGRSAA